jgi:hypothetical protein
MSILRVEQDGIEFFTVTETGESKISETGTARLCGVSQQAVYKLIQRAITTKSPPLCLKGFSAEDLRSQLTLIIDGVPMNVNLISARAAAAIIEYYAFESPHKTKTAIYSYRKFATIGIEHWIQGITGWKPEAQTEIELTPELLDRFLAEHHPKGTIAITANPTSILNILQNSNFSAAGYRIFLYLELQRWLDKTPEIDQICKDLTINRATLIHWIPKITKWSQCADEIQLQTRQGTEFDIQRRLHAELGGRMEVYTPAGRIDLVTDTEVIEIKRIAAWKDAFGEVLAKGITFPKHHKRIHLFGPSDKRLDMIKTYCETLNVNVSFEPIAI